ncbi:MULTISPECIES: uridine phosphorylase [Thermococcus]|uniref:Uridine phosphorylase n=2 Tax=Thermococcus sibiricus TaxID=172049 RepID=C6A1H2_THESM|nr:MULTISPECIES: uridine phosphorylase [Thermococcus]KUK28950.1 MAG: Uridine phosphorylase [Thermococcus sp. 40_45]HII67161.1 uridine phosphorylase [Thermococcaceae archaeon]ACS89467.1 Uridine phosphorylase [Thermococcus sibiricus MM 739]KUK17667.1 MAG: Uridine phosphorylase [Thermococcus sibiricus]MBC7094689.1 uridine phosphorylase [Thermococcus sp.]
MKKFMPADRPQTEERYQYHIACKPGDVARYVLLPGDPERVPRISALWDEAKEIAFHREYRTHTGKYKGVPISVVSTGIGGPSAAIAIEELAAIGADTFIRVGSTGAIQPGIEIGDLIIAKAAVRLEGTSKQYVRAEYPASADIEVTLALIEAAETLGVKYHVGITASTDSFYVGQARPGLDGYFPSFAKHLIDDLRQAKVTNFEMEAATLYTLANIYGLRAGCVCAVFANRITNEFGKAGEKEATLVASEAVKILHEWDEEKEKKGKKVWFPSLRKL